MEALTTMTGNVGGDVEHRVPDGFAAPVASFSLAVTPRIRRGDVWTDGDTTWVRVVCWRGLADRVRESVRRGDVTLKGAECLQRAASWLDLAKHLMKSLR